MITRLRQVKFPLRIAERGAAELGRENASGLPVGVLPWGNNRLEPC